MNPRELQSRYDVVVLGGGPAGAAAATALARAAASVLVADELTDCSFKVGESLPGIAGSVIARAGFPDILRRVSQIKCSGNRSSWGSPELQLRPGLLNPYGGGVHVDRVEFDHELLREAIAARADVCKGAHFQRAERSGKGWTMFFRVGGDLRTVRCDSVIDCMGRKASFARGQAAARVAVDKQVAIVSVLSSEDAVDGDLTTTIETARQGWWYSARVPNGQRVVVFFTDGDLLPGLQARSTEGFASLMEQSLHIRGFLAAGYRVDRTPAVVLADTSYLRNPAGSGWCAAGDAATALDPLASAGIMDAITSGSAAAGLVLSGFQDGEEYSQKLADQINSNIATRQSYYRAEARWRREPFWSRRHNQQLDSAASCRAYNLAKP